MRTTIHLVAVIAVGMVVIVGIETSGGRAGPPGDKRNEPPPPETMLPAPALAERKAYSNFADRGAVTKLTITHIEVTQGIQDVAHSVPMLAGRGIYARVFFDIAVDPTDEDTARLAGKLRVTSVGGDALTLENLYDHLNPSVAGEQNGQLERQRSNARSGLVFYLPADRVKQGTFTFAMSDVRERDDVRKISCTNCDMFSRTVSVEATAPVLRLTVIGIAFKYKGTLYEPRTYDFAMIPSWLRRAYPISDVIYDYRTIVYPDKNVHPPVDSDDPKPGDMTCEDVNLLLVNLRTEDVEHNGVDPRTHYYGLVFEGMGGKQEQLFMRGCSNFPDGSEVIPVGSGPTGPGAHGWDRSGSYGGWYAGHEIGHTLGRHHVGGACREDIWYLDANYPFPYSQISTASESFVGFDPGDTVEGRRLAPIAMPGKNIKGLGGRLSHDVMSYCRWQWISAYTRGALLDRLQREDGFFSSSRSPDVASSPNGIAVAELATAKKQRAAVADQLEGVRLLHVLVQIEVGWSTGKIVSLSPVKNAVATKGAEAPDTPVVETLTAQGKVYSSTPVTVLKFTDNHSKAVNTERGKGLIDIIVPIDATVNGVRVTFRGKTIAERIVGRGRPSLRNVIQSATEPKAALAGKLPIVLTWEGRHSSDNALTYSVLLSTDDGATWKTVAVRLRQPRLEIYPQMLSPTQRADAAAGSPIKYKVIANDGFNSSELTGVLR
jgi:hypothetical protein